MVSVKEKMLSKVKHHKFLLLSQEIVTFFSISVFSVFSFTILNMLQFCVLMQTVFLSLLDVFLKYDKDVKISWKMLSKDKKTLEEKMFVFFVQISFLKLHLGIQKWELTITLYCKTKLTQPSLYDYPDQKEMGRWMLF